MNRFLIIVFLSLLFLSCEKENNPPENPAWLNARISMMETESFYVGTYVYLYEWNNEYYYHIMIGLSSCMMCEFYDYRGIKVNWTQETIDDFQKNARKIRVVWQKTY